MRVAFAAAAETPEPEKPVELTEVFVTGSRLPTPATDTAQDVKIYTRKQIDQSGQTTLADFLNTLPDVSTATTESGFLTTGTGTTVRLHGLPVGSTLVLLNGRRVGNSGLGQLHGVTFFDLNTVPLAAVERIEVLAQGSSAVYGSDAIAGVINVILKKDFEGVAVNGRFGAASGTQSGDADVAWGHKWDRGWATLVGTYQTRGELAAFERNLTNDQDYRRYGGLNRDFDVCPDQANVYALGGGNLPGVGAPYAAVPKGYTGTPSQQEFLATAGTLNQCSVFRYASPIPATDRAGVLADGAFELTPSVEIYSDILLSHVHQSVYNSPPLLFGQPGFQSYTVGADNPFNPFGQKVGVSVTLSSLGRNIQLLKTNYFDGVVGGRGRLFETWNWDAWLWDSQDRTYYTQPDLNAAAVQRALNSSDPATALNPFVDGPVAPLAYLQSFVAQDRFDLRGHSSGATAVLRGQGFQLPGGPLGLALGGEYEREILAENSFFFPGPAVPTDFHRHSGALFAEARLPFIAPESAGTGERLAATIAGRFDHYNDFGNKTTPQFGIEWRPVTDLLARATYGRSFRAPDLIDLYAATFVSHTAAIIDRQRGNAPEIVTLTTGGNPDLHPETGVSRTLGLLYTNDSLHDLRLAITQWSIDAKNWIQKLPTQTIVDNEALFPGAITRAATCDGQPPCPITSVNATYLNFGELDVAGVDYQLSLHYDTGAGTFIPSFAATQTYRYTAKLTPGAAPVGAAGAAQNTGNWAPRWKGNVGLEWQRDAWDAYVVGRYVSQYRDYGSTQEIGDFLIFDASARYAIGRVMAPESTVWQSTYVQVGAANLFNRLPQFSNFNSDLVGYDPAQADIRGRFVYLQLGGRW